MCGTCGCGSGEEGARILMPGAPVEAHHHHHHEHGHHHGHDHHHHGHDHHHHDHDHHHHGHDHHHHDHTHTAAPAGEVRSRVLAVEQDVLRHNDVMAARNQGYFEARNILALNLVSSPGSGKTSILERTLKDLSGALDFYVIEGDQQTTRDAERIAALQVPVRQINTGKGCHLESDMIYEAVRQMEIAPGGVLMIENVGNLVCPSMFHLGEKARVVIISVTEGEDKPIKYPDMFHTSDLCLINKTDLLPYVACDLDRLKGYALQVNPNLKFLEVSAQTGEGMEAWYEWLQQQHQIASET